MKELSKIKKYLKEKGIEYDNIEKEINKANGYEEIYKIQEFSYWDEFVHEIVQEEKIILSDWNKKQFEQSKKSNLFDTSIKTQIDKMKWI